MIRALFNGFIGAMALTTVHQALRRSLPDAPQLDRVGMRGVERFYSRIGAHPPSGDRLFLVALIADLLANSILFSQVGSRGGFMSIGKGVSLGLSAGVGAATLPAVLGLSKGATKRTRRTAALTVGMFMLGGLAAGLAAQCGGSRSGR
ncbi:MAG: hypothetical protein C0507_10740 [Cyanobacteria bacterium PR.3.49]|jgi:hypothetical protein|nr:hypothetical protein [Cyanobacteria bacterium PR.3.49]